MLKRAAALSAVDLVDRRILIQDDAEQSAESIAPQVNLSPSAVQRRLVRLNRERVIEKISAIVDPRKIRLPLRVLVKVQCENNRVSSQEAFRRWVSRESSVQGCWHIAGEFDYFMVIVARDLDAYNALSQRMMSGVWDCIVSKASLPFRPSRADWRSISNVALNPGVSAGV